jgi:hypothetical protein
MKRVPPNERMQRTAHSRRNGRLAGAAAELGARQALEANPPGFQVETVVRGLVGICCVSAVPWSFHGPAADRVGT